MNPLKPCFSSKYSESQQKKLTQPVIPSELKLSYCEIRSFTLLMHINYVTSSGEEMNANHKAWFKDLENLPVNTLECKLPQLKCKLETKKSRKWCCVHYGKSSTVLGQ